jgi:hypothetical protein
MTHDLEIRRSIRKISRADFAAYPVWEWAIGEEETLGQDESFVRPTSLDSIAPDLARQYVVSARATLSDGSVLPACVEITVRARKVQAVPMFIFLQDRHLDFGGRETLTTLSHYTKSADVHPVGWELAVALAGQAAPLAGTVRRGLWARLTRMLRRTSLPTALSRV